MFTRDELASKTLEELQQLGKDLGVEQIGNPGYPGSWIIPLLAAGAKGMEDCENGVGMKRFPSATVIQDIHSALENIGQPTAYQSVLI